MQHLGPQPRNRTRATISSDMAKTESRADPSGKIYRQLFDAQTLNLSLLANRRSLCDLRLRLNVENIDGANTLHQKWEHCLEQWRTSRVQQIVQNFGKLFSNDFGDEFLSEQPEFSALYQSLREVSAKRCEVVSKLSTLTPPTCTSVLVSEWYEQLKSFNLQIDDLYTDLIRNIRNYYDQMWQERLEEVHRCEETLRNLGLSEAQVTNIVQSQCLPLMGQNQKEVDQRLAALDVSCDSVSRHSLSLSSLVFGIMQQASSLWEVHCSNLKTLQTKVQRDVEKLRRLQNKELQRKTVHLDEQLRILRQGSNEEALNVSLDNALLELQRIHDSCRKHLSDQQTVLDQLPSLYLLELQNYSSRLSAFFQLNITYSPSLKEFSHLDPSLKAAFIPSEASSEINTNAAQYQMSTELQDLCDKSNSVEFSSSRGLTYTGPAFTCPVLKEPLDIRQLEAFPVVLLSETLTRMRSLYVDNMEQHFHDSVLSALSLLSHFRLEALTVQEIMLQQFSAQHVRQHIFQPRLAELQLHLNQVDVHCETVSHTLSSLNTDVMDLLEAVSQKNQTFLSTVSSFENCLQSVDSLQRLESLSSNLKNYQENHMTDIQISRSSFRNSAEIQMEKLKQTTKQLCCSFRLFMEGGDMSPYEIQIFQKKLKKEMEKIDAAEESIHGQLEACHPNSLQQVSEVCSLQEKLTCLKSEFIFVEKTQSILRNILVKIKAAAATSNHLQSDISSKIHELQDLMGSKETQVQMCQVQALSILSGLSQTLHQQAQCLHVTLRSQQKDGLQSVGPSPCSALQPYGLGGALHDDPLLGVIKSLNRDRTSASTQTAQRGGAAAVQKREECPAIRRGGRARVNWRLQMFGPRPEPEQDPLSFSSKVSALLWEASDALMLTAEHLEKLKAEMDKRKQKFDQTLAETERDKKDIVRWLRLCISGEALQALRLKEEHRQQAIKRSIDCFVGAQTECLQLAGETFVTSLASLTEQLLTLFDLIMTVDEENTASQPSEDAAHRPQTGKRTWQGIPSFTSSVVETTATITTNKCTRGHEGVIQERDSSVKRFEEIYRNELLGMDSDKNKRQEEMEKWSVHWSQQLHVLTHHQH
uniref:Uncharacterized protein n=1 Tax=Knipowitschia caucasica TaxID=637954 RepID=A0AAV2JJN3_KNICA